MRSVSTYAKPAPAKNPVSSSGSHSGTFTRSEKSTESMNPINSLPVTSNDARVTPRSQCAENGPWIGTVALAAKYHSSALRHRGVSCPAARSFPEDGPVLTPPWLMRWLSRPRHSTISHNDVSPETWAACREDAAHQEKPIRRRGSEPIRRRLRHVRRRDRAVPVLT